MSALGQKQTFAAQKGMSALHPKADMCAAIADVCFGPITDMASRLFDQLVGAAVHYIDLPPALNNQLFFCVSAREPEKASGLFSRRTRHETCRPPW